MAELVGTFEHRSPEWYAARDGRLGGSEISAVVGLSPFESRFSLWHRKAGNVGPVEENPEMDWGRRLEPAVIDRFVEDHPEFGWPLPGTWVHEDRPWHLANPDRLIGGQAGLGGDRVPGGLEVKTSPFGDGYGPTGTDEVPAHVRAQCVWYGAVFDVYRWWVAVLIGGCDYREYLLEWEKSEADFLIEQGGLFMDSLHDGVPPDIDAHSATYQAIREMHPEIDSTVDVEIPNRVAHQFIRACEGKADAEAIHAYARSQLADLMGDARRAVWDGQTLATRQARNGGTPYLVAARKLPTIPTNQETAA